PAAISAGSSAVLRKFENRICCMGYLICDRWSVGRPGRSSNLPGSGYLPDVRAHPASREAWFHGGGCDVDYSDWTTAWASLIAASLRCGMVSCRHCLSAAMIDAPVIFSGISIPGPE